MIYPYMCIGDYLSYNGLIRFLSQYYDEIYVVDTFIDSYKQVMFRDNIKIKFLCTVSDARKFRRTHLTTDIIELKVYKNNEKFVPSGFEGNYFDINNKIGEFLNIKCDETTIFDNASGFYIKSGLPSNIRIDYFYYERDIVNETNFYLETLKKYNINNDKYTIICEYDNNLINKSYVNTKNIINIHKLSHNILYLLLLIENAEDVHILENALALMIYMMQIKGLLKPKKIYFHVTARNDRKCTKDNWSEHFFVRMMLNPKIDDWIIIT